MHEHEVILYRGSEDQAFIAEAPEFPGCMAHGDDQGGRAAEHQGRDAVPDRTGTSVRDWEKHAEAAGVAPYDATRIEKTLSANLTTGL